MIPIAAIIEPSTDFLQAEVKRLWDELDASSSDVKSARAALRKAMQRLADAGESQRAIAKATGRSQSSVNYYLRYGGPTPPKKVRDLLIDHAPTDAQSETGDLSIDHSPSAACSIEPVADMIQHLQQDLRRILSETYVLDQKTNRQLRKILTAALKELKS